MLFVDFFFGTMKKISSLLNEKSESIMFFIPTNSTIEKKNFNFFWVFFFVGTI